MATAATTAAKNLVPTPGNKKVTNNKILPFSTSITAPSAAKEKEKEQEKEQIKETTTIEEVKVEVAKEASKAAETLQERRPLTMEELTDKAERLHLLQLKYKEVKEKRKQLENFSISHDNANAQLNLVDAKGLSISTSNPTSINKLLIDWMADLNTALAKVESDMRQQLEA